MWLVPGPEPPYGASAPTSSCRCWRLTAPTCTFSEACPWLMETALLANSWEVAHPPPGGGGRQSTAYGQATWQV